MKFVEFIIGMIYMGKMVGAEAEIFDKLEPEPHKNEPAPQHWPNVYKIEA
jgi:hypothetical protein